MKKPQKYLMRMGLFCGAVIAIAAVLFPSLKDAFMANAILNGVIILALVIGVGFAFRRVIDLGPSVDWVHNFKKRGGDAAAAAPALLAPASSMLLSQNDNSAMRMSTLSMRTVLDGIVNRLEESREISRYLTGLLIFLGLLGTFWGLLGTIGAIGKTINSLSIDGTNIALMFDELKEGLQTPLGGMGTAFSSSLFGLAGSLVLGFLDLQASQAQTRFYNDVEDWLSTVTKLSRGEEGFAGGTVVAGGTPSAYATAVMEQTAEGMERLEKTLKRGEEDRKAMQQALTQVSQALNKLADMSAQPQQSLDPVSRDHISNLDHGMQRLIEQQARSTEQMSEDIRKEIKVLSRTIAAGLDEASAHATNQQPAQVSETPPSTAAHLTATKDDQL